MRHCRKLFSAALFAFAALSTPANAEVVIDFTQQGSNVVVQGSGTIDLTDLTFSNSGAIGDGIVPVGGAVLIGTGNGSAYQGNISGPSAFGTGTEKNPSLATGNFLGIYEGFDRVYVPQGYVSGAQLSATDTYDNTTLALFGLTVGTYTYTWGTGIHADSIVVNIAAVPEPSTWAMMILGFMGIGFMAYRRRNAFPVAA
jgi:PEP-CTERM motif